MSKLLRPATSCPECDKRVEAGYWRVGTMTVQPNGKRKLTEKGHWVGRCRECEVTIKM